MSKVLHSRLFRFLVCFLVICCFLINLSPLKSQATVVVGTALTLEALLAILFSMSIGVVAVDLTVETWNRIGTDLEETIITEVDTSELQKYHNLKEYWESIDPDGPEDPGEWNDMLKKALSGGLLSAIAGWLCTLVNIGGYEFDAGSVPDGWAIYNGYLLPSIEQTFPEYTHYVVASNYGYFSVFLANGPGYYDESKEKMVTDGQLPVRKYNFYDDGIEWKFNGDVTYHTSGSNLSVRYLPWNMDTIVWSNYDILDYKYKQSVIFEGSEPKYKYSEVIEPTIYVGDIPQQIKDGETDKNSLKLPLLDPLRGIKSPETALNDLNQLQQQLKDGTITLDQYLDQVKVQEQPDTEDPTSPPEDPSESTSPTVAVDPWEPPEDPGEFALDLSKVFPFCIPFDLYDFLSCLNAEPEAPVISWEIALPGGGSYPLEIDLSPFNSVAQLLRRLQLLLFIVALGIKTRDLIKG